MCPGLGRLSQSPRSSQKARRSPQTVGRGPVEVSLPWFLHHQYREGLDLGYRICRPG